MGVDTKVLLSGDVQIREVGKVLAILAGLPKNRRVLDERSNPGAWYVDITDISKTTPRLTYHSVDGVPSMVEIILKGKMVDGEESHIVSYHFEPSDGKREHGMRLLYPRSTPFWCAIGKELVKFFGGWIDYNDCDLTEVDFRARYPKLRNCPSEGKPWQAFQQKMWNLQPITVKDMQAVRKLTGYPDAGFERA